MRLTCPGCGAIGSIEAFTADDHAKRALMAVTTLPAPVAALVLGYLALFRPGSGRGLTWKRAETLVLSLQALVTASHIQWDRHVARPASPAIWAEALQRISANPPRRLPLKSHGYLTAMAYDLADEADRKTETARNQTERTGQFRTGGQASEPAQISVEEMREIAAKKKRLKVEG
jgi:hypothetical protein